MSDLPHYAAPDIDLNDSSSSLLTRCTVIVGTALYVSPEPYVHEVSAFVDV